MKDPYLNAVKSHYPHAVSTSDAVTHLFDIFQERFGLTPRQIMLADSICCDDVNSIEYPQEAYAMLGPFKMGGLNGFPFAGLTGMGAFAGHVPDDGAVLVFYGPHIGVSKNGAIGEIARAGQHQNSSCCGAARAALNKLMNGEIKPDHVTDLDYQMNTIEQIFLKNESRIKSAANPLYEATEAMYEAIDERIQLLVEHTNYKCRYVFLIGSILINGDHDARSYCAYKRFDCIDLETQKRVCLIDDFEEIVESKN
jgi:Limiting CO2-inducible proteins B/C beta carbonyic anhydrases